MTHRWRNWSRTQSADPAAVVRPDSVDDLVELVDRALAEGRQLRPIGTGHSFSGIGVPRDIQVDLSGLSGLISVEGSQVRLGAGTPLHAVSRMLAPHQLAMANMGDIDRQTLAGAISTGTHGTGVHFGGISTQVVGATIVDGRGQRVVIDAADPRLSAVAVGLGALGIIADVTLACVPTFSLRSVESTSSLDLAIDSFLEKVTSADHHEFYWFPHTDRAQLKTTTRLPAQARPEGTGKVASVLTEEVLGNGVFAAACEVGARFPSVVPPMMDRLTRALSDRTVTDDSAKVFASPRRVRFRELEYAIPLEQVPAAVREVRRLVDAGRHRVSFPVEVRAAAADDLMLSTASGRTSGYIAVHRFVRDDPAMWPPTLPRSNRS